MYQQPVDSKELCFFTGVWGLVFTSVWLVFYTAPHWGELVSAEVAMNGGSTPLILVLYASHTVNNGVHNYAWFVICEEEGSVATGLLQGAKAVALFIASAALFCRCCAPPTRQLVRTGWFRG